MKINTINNTNFQSRFVPNETFKRGFDEIKDAPAECRMFVRTIDALLRDGKDDVIEFATKDNSLITKINGKTVSENVCFSNEFVMNLDKGLRESLDYLRLSKVPNVRKNNVSDYEKPYIREEFAKVRELANSRGYDLGIFRRIDNIAARVGLKLEDVNYDRMALLSKKIFGK
ncbi:MAG: hypothetical protein NC408_06665 [Candidatus Gastranaerophilales bacterium]|nr:hypothetical protein [Candidatus Gastranaerophilales bacterium]MCM1073852.1 hypothetical protein [Bacteroides sp.]